MSTRKILPDSEVIELLKRDGKSAMVFPRSTDILIKKMEDGKIKRIRLPRKIDEHGVFPFRFKFQKNGIIYKPYKFISRITGKLMYNKFNETRNSMPIGYGIMNRSKDGVIVGFTEESFSMGWRFDMLALWEKPPIHYFTPARGDFIVKTTRTYPEFDWVPQRGHKSNWKFKLKDQ